MKNEIILNGVFTSFEQRSVSTRIYPHKTDYYGINWFKKQTDYFSCSDPKLASYYLRKQLEFMIKEILKKHC